MLERPERYADATSDLGDHILGVDSNILAHHEPLGGRWMPASCSSRLIEKPVHPASTTNAAMGPLSRSVATTRRRGDLADRGPQVKQFLRDLMRPPRRLRRRVHAGVSAVAGRAS
jgi:hypothetical protein